MVGDTHFERYIPENAEYLVESEQIKRHILCTGTSTSHELFLDSDSMNLQARCISLFYKLVKSVESRTSQSAAWNNFRPSLMIWCAELLHFDRSFWS